MYGSLMIDVAGTFLSEEDQQILSEDEVGGIILFARNVETPEQVRKLCDAIHKVKADIIIGVDQEGGRVARLRKGFTPLPAMGKLGEKFDENSQQALSLAYDCGYVMATEVMAVGIDISFAPVLDINGISKVIGDRAFHQSTEIIIQLANEFMRGMKDAGMATTGKHFPGHGSIAPDSHVADAIDERSFDDIQQTDLQPFIHCKHNLDALMPAHVIFSKIDNKPAGFSSKWLQDIVRGQLGFDGVLFSDDLSMKAAHVAGDSGARVTAALKAGCDMALVCNDRQAAKLAIATAKKLAKPNQKRLATMRSQIPQWKGSLEKTCLQFAHWQKARQNIVDTFFDDNNEAQPLKTATIKDPTNYKL